MRQIIKMQFGSHVYGTNVPESDHDYKGIFIPWARDIVMQRATKTSINETTKIDPTKRNTSQDVDFENFSLQGFLKLCAEGQTVALDMLFTPDEFIDFSKDFDGIWSLMRDNADRLICSDSSAFAGYCYKQAAKYGIKGSRLNALTSTIDMLKSLAPNDYSRKPLGEYAAQIALFAQSHEHVSIIPFQKKTPTGEVFMDEVYLEVCGRKCGYKSSIGQAIQLYQSIYDKYGDRAKLARENNGIDWKALMHAVRVCSEAIELLSTGRITFPRPEKDLLLKIRKGELPYSEVADLIAQLLVEVATAEQKSVLRSEVDKVFIEELIYNIYKREITDYA